MESNVFEKSVINYVVLRFFASTLSMILRILKIRTHRLISLKTVLTFSKSFAMSGLILSTIRALYTSAAKAELFICSSDSEVTFLGEGEGVGFCPFLFCFVYKQCFSLSISANFLVFHIFEYIFSKPASFLLLIFFSVRRYVLPSKIVLVESLAGN